MRKTWPKLLPKILIALPVALMLAAPAVNSGTREIKLSAKEQVKFDKKVADRVAGKPVSCISRIDQKNMTAVGDKYLIYQRSRNSKTIYVNEPRGGCRGAGRETLVTRRYSSSLCRGEIAEIVDLTTGASYGSCSFGAFVPYTKNES